MTMPMLCTPDDVRHLLNLEADTTSRYTDDTLGSNIRSAGWTLERACRRYFGDRTATFKFSTDGQASVSLPGLRSATSVTLSSSALTEDETYWLLPDVQQTGVFVAVQLRPFNRRPDGPWYLSVPDWFDRGLDLHNPTGGYGGEWGGTPNDLVIEGSWGYTDAGLPDPVRTATKFLAAWYTKRPDALLSGAVSTPDGNAFDLSEYPKEVRDFIAQWRLGGVGVIGL